MTTYVINPAGVQSVLNATFASAKTLGTALKPLSGAAEDAGSGCGGSAEIVSALDHLMASESARVDGMAGRVEACMTGAAHLARLGGHAPLVFTGFIAASRCTRGKNARPVVPAPTSTTAPTHC